MGAAYIFHRRGNTPAQLAVNAPALKSGNWYIPNDVGLASTATPTANSLKLFPFQAQSSFVISQLACFVTTQQAASNARLAIYANDPTTMKPIGAPLGETATLSCASAGSVAGALGANVAVAKSLLYWLGINTDTAGLVFYAAGIQGSFAHLIGAPNLTDLWANQVLNQGWTVAQAFGAMPTLTGATTFTNSYANVTPAIAHKVA